MRPPARGHSAARREGANSRAWRGDPRRAAPISRVSGARQTVSGGGMEWQPSVARGAIAKSPATAPRQGASLRDPENCGRTVSADCSADSNGESRGQAAESPGEGPASRQESALTIPDRQRESADVVGAQVGVSGATVKRVDRLARMAPDLLLKVAAGQLSAKKALNEALTRTMPGLRPGRRLPSPSCRSGCAPASPLHQGRMELAPTRVSSAVSTACDSSSGN